MLYSFRFVLSFLDSKRQAEDGVSSMDREWFDGQKEQIEFLEFQGVLKTPFNECELFAFTKEGVL